MHTSGAESVDAKSVEGTLMSAAAGAAVAAAIANAIKASGVVVRVQPEDLE